MFDLISIELTSQNITKHRPNLVVVISMGVMFDKKLLDYAQVLNSRTEVSITKDKDKEQRKRRQKEKSNTGSNQMRRKDKKYPFKKLNLLDLTV